MQQEYKKNPSTCRGAYGDEHFGDFGYGVGAGTPTFLLRNLISPNICSFGLTP